MLSQTRTARELLWARAVSRLAREVETLWRPVDAASLAVFRIAFGVIMFWEVCRYFDHGWIPRYWIDPPLNFTYFGFGWVRPLPGWGMYAVFGALGVLSLCIAVGLFYRLAAALFFIAFSYTYLLEQARYMNHFYLIVLLSFLLILLPAHSFWSFDAFRRPALAAGKAPAWSVALLRFQIGVVYFFGGVAKINADWLRGEPLRTWLARRTDFPLIGRFFADDWMVYLMGYGGLLLDLLIVPFLLWPKTRAAAFIAATLFHLMNARLFLIGIFPWFMIAATTIYFRPDWPRIALNAIGLQFAASTDRMKDAMRATQHKGWVLAFLGVYAAAQILLPLRHVLYPGDPSWTEEGHRYAWHMKLRTKSGSTTFIVRDLDSDRPRRVNPDDILSRWQARKMATHPEMILQFAHYLAHEERGKGEDNVAVYVLSHVSLNGHAERQLIDPHVDLSKVKASLRPAPWILPF